MIHFHFFTSNELYFPLLYYRIIQKDLVLGRGYSLNCGRIFINYCWVGGRGAKNVFFFKTEFIFPKKKNNLEKESLKNLKRHFTNLRLKFQKTSFLFLMDILQCYRCHASSIHVRNHAIAPLIHKLIQIAVFKKIFPRPLPRMYS